MKHDAIFDKNNRFVWMLLAFQGGFVNLGAFMSVHTFVSHLSGIPGLASQEYWKGNLLQSSYLLLVPISFFLGAFFSAIPTEVKRFAGKTPVYVHVLSAIGVIYCTLALGGYFNLLGEFGEKFSRFRDFLVLCLLGFACGSQNALFSKYSKSVIRTTHITGLVTDLGIGFAKNKIAGDKDEANLNRIRLELIAAFFLGSLLAFPIFAKAGFLGFIVPAFLSFGVGFRLYLSRLKNH